MMTTEEFVEKIKIFNRKEQFKMYDGITHTVRMIRALPWWNNVYLYHSLRRSGDRWVIGVYRLVMVVEMTAAAGEMEWYKRIYYAVFFPHAYFPAVRIMREKLRAEREKEQGLHSEVKENRPG